MGTMRLFGLAAGFVALTAAMIVAGFYLAQRHLLFRPDTTRPDRAAVGVPGLIDLDVTTADGLILHAWFLPPAAADRPVLVYLHGNGGNVGDRAPRIRRFAEAGWGGLFLDYRGYGGNPGMPSEQGLLADARAALAAIDRLGLGDRVVLYGESLGTGVAVALAAERAVTALVLESPYTSIADVARAHYPFLPVDLLLKDRFDALARIGAVGAPLLVLQGGRDRIIPDRLGRRLYDAATAPKHIWHAADAGHGNLFDFGAFDQIVGFVAGLPRFLQQD